MQLCVEILPLHHAQVGEKVLAAELPALALRAQLFPLVMDGVPDIEQGEKIRLRIVEAPVRGQSGFLLIERSFARVLDAQAGGDDEQFVRGVLVLRLKQHAAQRGIDGQPREIPAERGQLAPVIQRAQFLEQRVAVINRGGRGRLHERERLHLAEVRGLHAQNYFSEIGALNLRLGEGRARIEVFLRVEPDADAVLHTARAALALIGAALGDGFNRQTLCARARIVAADARHARVNDVTDSGNGQGCFGDVRRDDDLAPGGRGEDALLIRGTESAKERNDFRRARESSFELVARFANVPFARHENEHVARAGFVEDFLRRNHSGINIREVVTGGPRGHEGRRGRIAFAGGQRSRMIIRGREFLRVSRNRCVDHFHRIHAAGHFDDGRVVEMSGEGGGINGGRGDDQLEILALRQQLLQVAEQEINVEAALVRLVDDQRVVFRQARIVLCLRQ